MNISVIGTGYVGLVSAACFADIGNKVICVDNNKEKIENLIKGIMPIYEDGLEEICIRNHKNGNLTYTTDIKMAVEESQVIFIAVGTPPQKDGDVDMSAIYEVAKNIGEYINGYKVVVNKSTVPSGTQKLVTDIINSCQPKHTFDVISNPEFLREGTAIFDTLNTDRIVIGADNPAAADVLLKIYEPINTEKMVISPESAELIKYASNAFLATKIAFINEIANICDLSGANIDDVSRGMGLDKRISPHFLNAGIGYGGGCFPKDTQAMVKIAQKYNYDFQILKSVIAANQKQAYVVIDKLKTARPNIKGMRIAILGLAFKPNTDDIRGAASIGIIEELLKSEANIIVFDPLAMENAKKIQKNVLYANDVYEAISGAEVIIIVTEWEQFKQLDLARVKELMKNNVIIDGRNIFLPETMMNFGFEYYSVGRNN